MPFSRDPDLLTNAFLNAMQEALASIQSRFPDLSAIEAQTQLIRAAQVLRSTHRLRQAITRTDERVALLSENQSQEQILKLQFAGSLLREQTLVRHGEAAQAAKERRLRLKLLQEGEQLGLPVIRVRISANNHPLRCTAVEKVLPQLQAYSARLPSEQAPALMERAGTALDVFGTQTLAVGLLSRWLRDKGFTHVGIFSTIPHFLGLPSPEAAHDFLDSGCSSQAQAPTA